MDTTKLEALKPFEREERYIVIKRKHLQPGAENAIKRIASEHGGSTVECVVVESDWPEYETVWQMIEDRVTGRTRPATSAEPVDPERLSEAMYALSARLLLSDFLKDDANHAAYERVVKEWQALYASPTEAPALAEVIEAARVILARLNVGWQARDLKGEMDRLRASLDKVEKRRG